MNIVATKLNHEISLFFGTSIANFTLLRERDPSQGVKSGSLRSKCDFPEVTSGDTAKPLNFFKI